MKKVTRLLFALAAILVLFASTAEAQRLLYSTHGGREHYYLMKDGTIAIASIQGGNLANVPDYEWWYGCSPTSTGMMLGFYDRNGYSGLEYPDLVPGGTAESSNYGNSSALVNGIIASSGHIAAFYVAYGNSGNDPDPGSHTSGSFDCLADFMGTSQDSCLNSDGSTTFWNKSDGSAVTPATIEGWAVEDRSGLYGIKEYLDHVGYSYATLKNQKKYSATYYNGITYAQYQAEIDAGRPVLVHIVGHTMLGWGYSDSPTPQTIFVRDTWDEGSHTMTWDGTYPASGGELLSSLTCLTISGGSTPTPRKPLSWMMLLLGD